MLLTLLIWIWITIISYIYGLMTIELLKTIFGFEKTDTTRLPIVLILGVCILGTIATCFSRSMKIGLIVNIFVISIAVIYLLFEHKKISGYFTAHVNELKKNTIFSLAAFFILFLIILFETSIYTPKNFDTALYHAQSIHWIEEYKAVPGLGNFHRNIAYDNNWFLPCALFSFSFFKLQSFHVLNGIFFLFGAFYFLSTADDFFRKHNRLSGLAASFVFPISVYLYTNFSSSPGTDMPDAIIIWTIFLMFINKIEEQGVYEFDIISVIIVIFTSYLITVKLAGAPLFLFAIYITARELFRRKFKAFLLVLLSCLIIFPWLVRNVIISGYVVYPVIQTGIFNVDWKMPGYIVLDDINGIKDWSFPIGNMSVFKYLPLWLMGLNIQYKFVIWPLFTAAFLSMVYYMTLLPFHIKKLPAYIKKYKNYLICHISAACGVLFLFYSAPDVRYGAGLFTVFSLLVILPALIRFINNNTRLIMISKFYSAALIVFIIVFEVFLFDRYFFSNRGLTYLKDNVSGIPGRIIIPADYGQSPTGISEYYLDKNHKYYIPNITTAYCWHDPFPSTAQAYKGLELRGGSFEDGFRIKNR